MLKTNQGSEHSAQAMPCCDHVGIRIELPDFFVKLDSRFIIPVWLSQLVPNTLVVTGVGARLAVAHLAP